MIYKHDVTATTESVLTYNDYDGYLIYAVRDNSKDPDTYTYTFYWLSGSALEGYETKLAGSTDILTAVHWRYKILMANHDATSDEIKAFYTTWDAPTEKVWSQTVASSDVDKYNISLSTIGARAWVVKNTSTHADTKTFYDYRSWEDGTSSFKVQNDGTLGNIHTFDMAYMTEYAIV